MKRTMLCTLLGLSIVALASAQRNDRLGRGWGFPPAAPTAPQVQGQPVTVTGNLTIIQGGIAVQDNGVTYHVGGLSRFIGFIEGLKDGAQVTVEGSALTYPADDKIKFLRVAKLTINGKDYDLAPPEGMGYHFGRWRQ
ncbi:MAG: hypothetical protein LBD29_03280 [Treponema sp.]|nr:hypothetical protein [Treponema sp.]